MSIESVIYLTNSSPAALFSFCLLSQHQGLFQRVVSSHQVAKVLKLQHQSFQWIFRIDFLLDCLVWSPCCPRDSQESSPAPQFESINSSAFSLLYGLTLTSIHYYWKTKVLTVRISVGKVMSLLFNTLCLEKAMAPHSSPLAWKIPWMEEPGRLQFMGSLRVGHDWVTWLSRFTFMHWRRQWQPTPVFLPAESQGQWSQVGCRLWGRTESDTTEAT